MIGATVVVVCEAQSHPTKVAKVGTFREVLGHADQRLRIELPEWVRGQSSRGLCCRLCGDDVTARGENIMPVVGKLMDAGVSRITLDALRRRLPTR